MATATTTKHKTACILCSLNCGIEVEANRDDREMITIIGDKEHPVSKGYICQKATRLNYYMNQPRLTTPLRKKEDGSYEEVSWDVAIQDIADRLLHIRNTHGGETIAYAGGGGQGNHLGGFYGNSLRNALGTPYLYSSLAQEKTGNFWVHGKLFGKQNTAYAEPVEDAEYVIIIGANPIQSHGIHNARKVINELSRDPDRTLVVIDPRKTETAKKADLFLQVKPGHDAWLMSAMLGVIVQEDLVDHEFLKSHTTGYEDVKAQLLEIPIQEYSEIAGIDEDIVRKVARDLAAAKTTVIRSDLGIEMSYNSTLNAYLKRLLFLLTGHFGRHGTNHLTTFFIPLLGHSRDPEEGGITTAVTKTRAIGKLFPPAILPAEINSDHPKRLRALIVDSCNPVATWPDTHAQLEAYEKLDLMVVIDVANTETAQIADYVLPAANQFEKHEATFFGENFLHFRKPIFKPLEGTLPEPEIYTRILRAMGEIPERFETLSEAAKEDMSNPGKGHFQNAFMKASMEDGVVRKYAPIALREAYKEVLPADASTGAAFFFASSMFANKYPKAVENAGFNNDRGNAALQIFNSIMTQPSGTIVGKHNYEDHWDLIRHKDKKVHLHIPEMMEWLEQLPERLQDIQELETAYPYNLIAGERRTYNANTVIRNPEWRKSGGDGALKINPVDAEAHAVSDGDSVQLTSRAGIIRIIANVTDEVAPGVLSMPHGHGLSQTGDSDYRTNGARVNMLTSADYCDPLAKTPYHKNVRVRLEKVG